MTPAHAYKSFRASITAFTCIAVSLACYALEPIPDKLVVLTFDDSVSSHSTVVRPLLKQYGLGATFFITEGFSFPTNKVDYMTWEQIAELHRDGFEIGNHTRDHMGVNARTVSQLKEQIEAINERCAQHGIPRTTSFAFPGNAIHAEALPVLKQLGIRFARRGGAPEHPKEWGRGVAYDPQRDHPLLIPSAGDARPDWTLDDFKRAVAQAKDGQIAVVQFHGVPDLDHPWVHTPPERFQEYMKYLADEKFRVIALRDLARYVDPTREPPDPMAVIEERKAARPEVLVEGEVVDAGTGRTIPARLYIQAADGSWHFPKSAFARGTSVKYQRRNFTNTNIVEMHTTLSADPFRVELSPGQYTFTIERGHEYFPETKSVTVARDMPQLKFALRRWINMAERGWFSGDTHVHRDPADLASTMLAEDVNVVLPMTQWTTVDTVPPSRSPRNFLNAASTQAWQRAEGPIAVDPTHVWHPRNTEYEIFQTAGRSHTLGAVLIVNHKTEFDQPVFPLREIAAKARREGALIDLEKHNWPWSIAVVPLLNVDLFELANNHHWRTEFGIRNWAVPAPEYMQLPGNRTGLDTEEAWTMFGFQTYYALLNCGFRLQPTAGTANGVHPVPLGFSRVYVRLPGPFRYEAWIDGLKNGRSFVSTGPMMFVQINDQDPGAQFKNAAPATFRVAGAVQSPAPLDRIEIVYNSQIIERVRPANRPDSQGSFVSSFNQSLEIDRSGWVAARCFFRLPDGRLRFAHTAPWHIEIEGKPLRPRRAEIAALVKRVEDEIARNTGPLSEAALDEYRAALAFYREKLRDAE